MQQHFVALPLHFSPNSEWVRLKVAMELGVPASAVHRKTLVDSDTQQQHDTLMVVEGISLDDIASWKTIRDLKPEKALRVDASQVEMMKLRDANDMLRAEVADLKAELAKTEYFRSSVLKQIDALTKEVQCLMKPKKV